MIGYMTAIATHKHSGGSKSTGVAVTCKFPSNAQFVCYSHIRSPTILNQVNSTRAAPRAAGHSSNGVHAASSNIGFETHYTHLKVACAYLDYVLLALEAMG